MCPILEGADLTQVSTTREPLPEGDYVVTVFESEIQKGGKTLVLKTRVEEPAEFAPRQFWDYINLIQNDGKPNKISLEQIKRYLEAVFGKDSPEAENTRPQTDILNGHQVRLYLIIDEFKDEKSGEKKRNNKVKKILPA